MNRGLSSRACVAPAICLLTLVAWRGAAAEPSISEVSPRGLQIGGTTTITIDGQGLPAAPRLVVPFAIGHAAVKEGATANKVQLEIVVPDTASPGIYPLRIAGPDGISNVAMIGIDRLPQLPLTPETATLPVALHGRVTGTDSARTTFAGKAGERIVIDVEARRLGGALNPTIHLYGPTQTQIDWAQPMTRLAGDSRIETTLPTDGTYTVEVHDQLYRGAEPAFFRLKLGQLEFADMVFPLAIQRGVPGELEILGSSLAAGTKVPATIQGPEGTAPAPLVSLPTLTGAPPRVIVSDMAEVVEQASATGEPQTIVPGTGVSGRIGAAGEIDRYRLTVTPGAALRFDVLADRAGSPLDGVLKIQNEAGAELAASDDRDNTVDPGLDFTVPADTTAVIVQLSDLLGRGGPGFIYRLAVSPAGGPDYSLSLFADRQQAPQEGVSILRVRADRRGYDGPIKLALQGLPGGVTAGPAEIPAGATDCLITLSGTASGGAAVIKIVGETGDPNLPIARVARIAEDAAGRYQPWLRSDVAVASTGPAKLRAVWEATSEADVLPTGYYLPTRVAVARGEGQTGAVRLALVTSQIMPQKTITKDFVPQQVDDAEKALRVEGEPMIPADQSAADLKLLVPSDLPAIAFDLAVKAELLSADGQSVVATAFTPARRIAVGSPVSVQLAGEANVEAKAGGGPTGKLSGKLVRAAGFNLPLRVTLTGLPPELPPPFVEVAADAVDFELDVAFPFGTALGGMVNVKLAAGVSGTPQFMPVVQIPLAVNVVQGDPPPPPGALHPLFEDDSYFVSLLFEGDGKAALEFGDRYSGSASLKAISPQKFRQKMPNWGYKVSENPADGEFRYIRFAWKKTGGANIVLQLAGNGQFGPLKGDRSRPAYRYEAGGENPYAEALRIDEKLPTEWVVVTRDLFTDFGAFQIDGIAFTPLDGQSALFDHIYLAKTEADFANCPAPLVPEPPLAIFEDDPAFVANLTQGAGMATLEPSEKFSGGASVKVTPDQKFNPGLPGVGIRVRQNPGPGEFRYVRFAWKKQGGTRVALQLAHDGVWGPSAANPGKFRYDAGTGEESFGAALRVSDALPTGFEIVTRDLYADFGEFTLTGLALSPQDGDFALFDHIYLGRTPRDFELVRP